MRSSSRAVLCVALAFVSTAPVSPGDTTTDEAQLSRGADLLRAGERHAALRLLTELAATTRTARSSTPVPVLYLSRLLCDAGMPELALRALNHTFPTAARPGGVVSADTTDDAGAYGAQMLRMRGLVQLLLWDLEGARHSFNLSLSLAIQPGAPHVDGSTHMKSGAAQRRGAGMPDAGASTRELLGATLLLSADVSGAAGLAAGASAGAGIRASSMTQVPKPASAAPSPSSNGAEGGGGGGGGSGGGGDGDGDGDGGRTKLVREHDRQLERDLRRVLPALQLALEMLPIVWRRWRKSMAVGGVWRDEAYTAGICTRLAEALHWMGAYGLARKHLESVRTGGGHSTAMRNAHLRASFTLPVHFRSRADIVQSRRQLRVALRQLVAGVGIHSTFTPLELHKGLGFSPTYGLVYHGFNDRDLMERTAVALNAITGGVLYAAPTAAHVPPPVLSQQRASRIRVAFASAHFYSHTMGKVMLGPVARLPRDRFEIVLVRPPTRRRDAWSEAFEKRADAVIDLPPDPEQGRATLLAARLDALVFADVGMSFYTYLLAFGRMAPVQIAFYGHPVTTGLRSIDYFISSDLLEGGAATGDARAWAEAEAEGADAHVGFGAASVAAAPAAPTEREASQFYTEQLVRFRGNAMFFPRPRVPGVDKDGGQLRSRNWLGLPPRSSPHGNVYVCPQQLQKLHPQMDVLFERVLALDPRATIALLQPRPGQATVARASIARRMRQTLGERVFDSRIVWVKLGPEPGDFMSLLLQSDVFLDTAPFGGGITALDACRAKLPIVSLPAAQSIIRQVRALYGMACAAVGTGIGVSNSNTECPLQACLTPNVTAYAAQAVRLGTNRTYNQYVRDTIGAEAVQAAIFENEDAIDEWGQFLWTATRTTKHTDTITQAKKAHLAVVNGDNEDDDSHHDSDNTYE